jgi:hypothetical protein
LAYSFYLDNSFTGEIETLNKYKGSQILKSMSYGNKSQNENLNVGTMISGTQDMSNNSVIEKYYVGKQTVKTYAAAPGLQAKSRIALHWF